MRIVTALRLGRVSNLPTVWSNVLAGAALGGTPLVAAPIALLCLALSLLYVGGMYLNDAFDAEVDARERPERPIPAGEVARSTVFAWGGAMLALGVALAFGVRFAAGCGALATAAVIVLYDYVHKRTALAPALMGACRIGVYVSAALAASEPRLRPVLVAGVTLFAYVMGLTYAAARENTSALVRVGPLLGLAAPLAVYLLFWARIPTSLLLVPLFAIWTVRAVRLVRSGQSATIRRGITALIAGISLVDAFWLSAHAAGLLPVLCALIAFVLTLLLQRKVAGT